MKKTNENVLAISPKSTHLGVAVFQRDRLLYYGLCSLWSKGCTRLQIAGGRVRNLIDHFNVGVVVLEELAFPQQKAGAVNRISETVKKAAASRGVQILSNSARHAKLFLSRTTRPDREKALSALVSCYPELKRVFAGQSERQRRYWMPLFNAIALGHRQCQEESPGSQQAKGQLV